MQWSSGYNVDIGYTFGLYFKSLSPKWLNFSATCQGIPAPYNNSRFLELGCGHGFSLILLAGMYPDHEFLGIDFNPEHIAHGRKFAAQAGLKNIRFEEADFFDLAKEWPQSWGRFDYVVSHGVYTWISKSVREALVKTINHAALPGAIVYISYNILPGWISGAPIQHLLRLWQTSEGIEGREAIVQGVNRLKSLMDASPIMGMALPSIRDRINSFESHDPTYLVHEYLQDHWQPLWFDQMVQEISAAKLVHVGTANASDLYLGSFLTQAQREILIQYKNPIVREVMMDVLTNRGHRQDLFVRGKTPFSAVDQQNILMDTAFVQLKSIEESEIKVMTSAGEIGIKSDKYNKVLYALEKGPKTLREIISFANSKESILEIIVLLLHNGILDIYRPVNNKKSAKAINSTIIKSAANGVSYKNLIAPEIGSVLRVDDVDMIMMHEVLNDVTIKDPGKLAQRLVDRLIILGKILIQDGRKLSDQESMMPYAKKLAEVFMQNTFKNWKIHGIV